MRRPIIRVFTACARISGLAHAESKLAVHNLELTTKTDSPAERRVQHPHGAACPPHADLEARQGRRAACAGVALLRASSAEGATPRLGLRTLVRALQHLVDCGLTRGAHWWIPFVQGRYVARQFCFKSRVRRVLKLVSSK